MIKPDFANNPPLILIVDDQKSLRLLLHQEMKKEGYRVAEALNGEECLELVKQIEPDMILLDAIMPGIDGFDCCAQLKKLLSDDCPPILMITSLDDPASVDRAFEAGATDFVTKPIFWAVLRQRVRHLLKNNWAMKELQKQIERERLLALKLEAANRELERLASVDGLTQIANRRCFDEYLQREWKRSQREQLPLSLILCDVDFFKLYNDSYGHQAGDECLRLVANAIRESARRPADLVSRYGGEEFGIILPNTDSVGAIQVAEAIREAVKALTIPHSGSQFSQFITISLGVASVIPRPDSAMNLLICSADRALYEAKFGGRDRVVFHPSFSIDDSYYFTKNGSVFKY